MYTTSVRKAVSFIASAVGRTYNCCCIDFLIQIIQEAPFCGKCADSNYTFQHKALGADKFRFSADFGQNWFDWETFSLTSSMPSSNFSNFWGGNHVIVQCELCLNSTDLTNDLWLKQTGLRLLRRLWYCTQTVTMGHNEEFRNFLLVDHSTTGVSTVV